MADEPDTTRRQFLASATAVAFAARHPVKAIQEQMPGIPVIPIPVDLVQARVDRMIARFDARGAVYFSDARLADTYGVEWFEPDYPTPDGQPWRHHCRLNAHDEFQRLTAQTIRGRLNV